MIPKKNMRNYIIIFIILFACVGCGNGGNELKPNTNLSVKEKIAELEHLIVPTTGTEKGDVDSIYGTPGEIKEPNGKYVPADYPMHEYELLPPAEGQKFCAKLYVTYQENKVWRAEVNHLCVVKGRIAYKDDSPEARKQNEEIEAEETAVLKNLTEIFEKFYLNLQNASWGRKMTSKEK
ncbi:MAG: hypothetical protein HZA48_04785 [Planctomycetes bacterium]|nr:hypothetical protein [Planctomycetota bacterium]